MLAAGYRVGNPEPEVDGLIRSRYLESSADYDLNGTSKIQTSPFSKDNIGRYNTCVLPPLLCIVIPNQYLSPGLQTYYHA